MKVKWREGSRVNCSPAKAHAFFEKIRKECGTVDMDIAVEKSRPKNAPLHNELTWDDGQAAHAYRKSQMASIVRKLEVVRDDMVAPTRAYEAVRVEISDAKPVKETTRFVYRSTEEILQDPAARADLLQRAIADAAAYRRRYAVLSELSLIIQAIDDSLSNLA